VLFLTTLAFHLMVPQRVPGAPGAADLHAATDLLLKVLGGFILLVLLYTVFARIVRRDSSPSTGIVKDNVFLDVVARLRDKEHELERLRSAAEARARELESYNENILRSVSSGVSTTLLKDREGGLIGTTFVCTDLTEIKALQEQVEMRERMTVLGQMSAGIAHEFRNLMGTILGAAKLVARQTPPDSPVHESIQTVTHVISDMDHLI